MLFTAINIVYATMVNTNQLENLCFTITIILGEILTIIIWDFKFDEELNNLTIQSLVLSVIFALLVAPSIGYFSKAILEESVNEAKLFYAERDSYRQLFDALQEGIIVVQNNKVTFMNQLSNIILSSITGMEDYLQEMFVIGDNRPKAERAKYL